MECYLVACYWPAIGATQGGRIGWQVALCRSEAEAHEMVGFKTAIVEISQTVVFHWRLFHGLEVARQFRGADLLSPSHEVIDCPFKRDLWSLIRERILTLVESKVLSSVRYRINEEKDEKCLKNQNALTPNSQTAALSSELMDGPLPTIPYPPKTGS